MVVEQKKIFWLNMAIKYLFTLLITKPSKPPTLRERWTKNKNDQLSRQASTIFHIMGHPRIIMVCYILQNNHIHAHDEHDTSPQKSIHYSYSSTYLLETITTDCHANWSLQKPYYLLFVFHHQSLLLQTHFYKNNCSNSTYLRHD